MVLQERPRVGLRNREQPDRVDPEALEQPGPQPERAQKPVEPAPGLEPLPELQARRELEDHDPVRPHNA